MSTIANVKDLPPGEHSLMLDGPAGKVEALLTIPDQADFSRVALICHPHPLYGGTMHNKVVTTVAKACDQLDIATLRFQFRGVGLSEGEHDEGVGEQEDVKFLAEWLKTNFVQAKLLLFGFSFGAYVGAASAQTIQPDLLISIAPAVNNQDYNKITDIHCAWHVLVADSDEVVPPEEIYTWFSERQAMQSAPFVMHRFADASHFFHGRLIDLRMKLMQILGAEG